MAVESGIEMSSAELQAVGSAKKLDEAETLVRIAERL